MKTVTSRFNVMPLGKKTLNQLKSLLCLSLLSCTLALTPAQASPKTEAAKVITQMTGQLSTFLNNDSSSGLTEKQIVEKVRNIIGPFVDGKAVAKLVLQNAWKQATPAQKKAFIPLLNKAVINSFVEKITLRRNVAFGTAKSTILGSKRVNVSQTIHKTNGTTMGIDFVLRKTAKGWLLYDIQIEGISAIISLRDRYKPYIKLPGLVAAISRLSQ